MKDKEDRFYERLNYTSGDLAVIIVCFTLMGSDIFNATALPARHHHAEFGLLTAGMAQINDCVVMLTI